MKREAVNSILESSTREVPKSIVAVVDVVAGDGLADYREIEPLIERTRDHQKYILHTDS